MRRFIAALLLALTIVGGALSAHAAGDFTTTFSGDNAVTAFFIDSALTGYTTSDWRTPLTVANAAVDPAVAHVLSWDVTNDGGAPNKDNPAGFLGQFTLGGNTYLSGVTYANVTWGVLGGALGVYGLNGGDDIWTRVNGGKPISGISTQAFWIGQGSYPGSAEKFTITASYTPVPVPVPAGVWLLGSAVAGLVAFRKRGKLV